MSPRQRRPSGQPARSPSIAATRAASDAANVAPQQPRYSQSRDSQPHAAANSPLAQPHEPARAQPEEPQQSEWCQAVPAPTGIPMELADMLMHWVERGPPLVAALLDERCRLLQDAWAANNELNNQLRAMRDNVAALASGKNASATEALSKLRSQVQTAQLRQGQAEAARDEEKRRAEQLARRVHDLSVTTAQLERARGAAITLATDGDVARGLRARADAERVQREKAVNEAARLEDECNKLRRVLESERRRGDEQKRRADEEARRAGGEARRADLEARRADEESKRADEERKRASEERKRANEQMVRADSEKKCAEEQRNRANRLAERVETVQDGELQRLGVRRVPSGAAQGGANGSISVNQKEVAHQSSSANSKKKKKGKVKGENAKLESAVSTAANVKEADVGAAKEQKKASRSRGRGRTGASSGGSKKTVRSSEAKPGKTGGTKKGTSKKLGVVGGIQKQQKGKKG